jgi:hypothetical protein
MAGDKVDRASAEVWSSRWRQKVRHVAHPPAEGINVMSALVDSVHLVQAEPGEPIGLVVDGEFDLFEHGGRLAVRKRHDQVGLAGYVVNDVGCAVGRSDT